MATNIFSFENLMNSIKEINTRAGGMSAVLFNLPTNSFDSVE